MAFLHGQNDEPTTDVLSVGERATTVLGQDGLVTLKSPGDCQF